ncbi:MAG: bi-domain-containing oxidoreductase [Acidobacteriales bacterium]|nr:bi-domain-containing oxidoreductase [Terriglobales bacterium]
MKQALQYSGSGDVVVADVPVPKLLTGCVLVRIHASLVSAGTERAASEFAAKSLLQKARVRPDLVREVVNKIRRDGLFSAAAAVRSRLDQSVAPGYSSAGTVVAVGSGIPDINVGDSVACAGAGYAVHAEYACVPRLLVARIPRDARISFEEAAFTTVGAVALHGIRLADAGLGDTVAVIGLGLLGQLTVQLLKAAGCRVLGMDIVPARAKLAAELGADAVSSSESDFRAVCFEHSRGHGVDAVLITAETPSSAPVQLAAEVARERAVVVAVGTVGMEIERRLYYEKELTFRISRSYGPGRYDSAYEQKGRDYPIGYVRWTETRNMEAFLHLLASRKLALQPLISHRFPITNAPAAYELIKGNTGEAFLGVLIVYPDASSGDEFAAHRSVEVLQPPHTAARADNSIGIGVLGAGSFAMSTLLPAIKHTGNARLIAVCAANGQRSRHAAQKFGFRYCATDETKLLDDPEINTIVIATRHNLHAPQILSAITAGKHIFCEKPLCLTEEELSEIVRHYCEIAVPHRTLLMVGFNRRFAPMVQRLKAFTDGIHEPLALHYRVNAGYISPDHWTNDIEIGGGRILGEACHFVDLLTFLAASPIIEVRATTVRNPGQYSGDNVILSLQFANGSSGTISYLSSGDRTASKERLEIFGGGAVAILDDFRYLELVRHGRKQISRSRFRQDKGHRDEWRAFTAAINSGGKSPIPFEDLISTTLATLKALDSRASGEPVAVDSAGFLAAHCSSNS